MKAKSGFTLVEILIVVIILGILAAIVIPQFTNASEEAKESALVSDLQTVRSQLELYKMQHNDVLPAPESGGATWNLMTMYTDVDGTTNATKTTACCFGPYLMKLPINQFNNKATVGSGTSAAGSSTYGWYLNTSTGAFYADDPCHNSL